MIPKKKELKLIRIYMYICDLYDSELKYYCQKYFTVKDIHTFASEYLSSWFPDLPSYQTFNLRLNRLSEAFKILNQGLISSFIPEDCDFDISLVDSMLVITCAGRNREGRVAKEITAKGFCSTKNQYYYGLKLHALAFRRKGIIPFPESLTYTPAEDNDLTVFKQAWGNTISNRTIFGDNIYSDFEYFNQEKAQIQNVEMLTPVKAVKGQ